MSFKNNLANNKSFIILFILLLIFFITIVLITRHEEKFIHKTIFISTEQRIVVDKYAKKELNITTYNIHSINYKQKGYINKYQQRKYQKEWFETNYYVVYSNANTALISKEKFDHIHKGDKVIIKTTIIQQNDEN
jgi:hypothetical protein